MSEPIITKKCSKCKEIKLLLKFHKDLTKIDKEVMPTIKNILKEEKLLLLQITLFGTANFNH